MDIKKFLLKNGVKLTVCMSLCLGLSWTHLLQHKKEVNESAIIVQDKVEQTLFDIGEKEYKFYIKTKKKIALVEGSSSVACSNNIQDNNRSGIYIDSISTPNLGENGNPSSPGLNTITGNGQWDVYSLNPNLIKAENNYWDWPISENIYGNLDWDPPAGWNSVINTSLGQIKALYK